MEMFDRICGYSNNRLIGEIHGKAEAGKFHFALNGKSVLQRFRYFGSATRVQTRLFFLRKGGVSLSAIIDDVEQNRF